MRRFLPCAVLLVATSCGSCNAAASIVSDLLETATGWAGYYLNSESARDLSRWHAWDVFAAGDTAYLRPQGHQGLVVLYIDSEDVLRVEGVNPDFPSGEDPESFLQLRVCDSTKRASIMRRPSHIFLREMKRRSTTTHSCGGNTFSIATGELLPGIGKRLPWKQRAISSTTAEYTNAAASIGSSLRLLRALPGTLEDPLLFWLCTDDGGHVFVVLLTPRVPGPAKLVDVLSPSKAIKLYPGLQTYLR